MQECRLPTTVRPDDLPPLTVREETSDQGLHVFSVTKQEGNGTRLDKPARKRIHSTEAGVKFDRRHSPRLVGSGIYGNVTGVPSLTTESGPGERLLGQ